MSIAIVHDYLIQRGGVRDRYSPCGTAIGVIGSQPSGSVPLSNSIGVADRCRTVYQRLANALPSGASEEVDCTTPERASNHPSTSHGKGATA